MSKNFKIHPLVTKYRNISMINPEKGFKDKVILFGRGPSVDNLDLDRLNEQKIYDTCTITDAIKLLNNPTFAFQYHKQGIIRCREYLKNPSYVLYPVKIIIDHLNETKILSEKMFKFLTETKKCYVFQGHHIKFHELVNDKFELYPKKVLYNSEGSVVGAVNFLAGFMKYKEIYYIGFDGGSKYGKLVHSGRKPSKIEGAMKDYKRSWDATLKLVEKYHDLKFEPLNDCLLKE